MFKLEKRMISKKLVVIKKYIKILHHHSLGHAINQSENINERRLLGFGHERRFLSFIDQLYQTFIDHLYQSSNCCLYSNNNT
jgi:hypothetical protein